MESAALFISIVSALATGAAAIMAWQSRADSLRAEVEARAAEASALAISRSSAEALAEANRLSHEHFEVSREEAARRERAKWAARLLRWANVRLAQAEAGMKRPELADDPSFAQLTEQRVALVDPRAHELYAAVLGEVLGMVAATKDGQLPKNAMTRMTAWSVVVDNWIIDPSTKKAAELSAHRAEVEKRMTRPVPEQ